MLASACSAGTSASGSDSPASGGSATSTGSGETGGASSGAPVVPPKPAGNGCPANSTKRPAGAKTGRTADLDLDGEEDTLWIADVDQKRVLGVTTASGATFSTTFRSAAPQAASAVGQKMASAGPAIILLNGGRSVLLYDVINCSIVPTSNPQGQQYTFDLGFTGYGTGVECVRNGSGYQLAGLLAKQEGSGYTVTRTAITLSEFGRRARNGATSTLTRGAGQDSPVVEQARTVTCGSGAQVTEEQ